MFAYFAYDSVFIVFMALMSFTNGFFSSLGKCASLRPLYSFLAMVYGPQAAPEHVRGQVGGYLGTTLVAGLLCGDLLSLTLAKFL